MKRAAELTLFAALAGVIHVALFARTPDSGIKSSGSGGDATVSIQAAPETIANMVETWEKPPETLPQPTLETSEPTPQAQAPVLPQFDLAQAPRAAVQVALFKPERSDSPEVDSTPPPPPPPKPQPKPEPKPEPEPAPKPQPKPAPEPQPKAQQAAVTSAGRAEQKAAGSGGSAQAGQAGGSQTSTADAGRQAKLQTIWGAKIRTRIMRRMPNSRDKGVVTVYLKVSRDGQLLSSRILKSSGNAKLDQLALTAVKRAGRLPKAPKKLAGAYSEFRLPIGIY
jgi:protein TonB